MSSRVGSVPKTLWGALFLAVFAAAAGTHALTPIFPELKRALGVRDAEVRLLTSVFTLGYSVSGFVLGIQSDRLGRRAVLLGSLGLYIAANALLLLTDSYRPFFVLRALAGLGTGGIVAVVIASSADLASYERRGRVMSFVLAGSFAAVVVGIPISALLAKVATTAMFGFLAGISTVAAWLLWRLLPPFSPGSGGSSWALAAAAIRARGAVAALTVTTLNTVAAFCVITSLADHCVDRFGADLDQRTLLFLVLGLSALPGAWIAGRLSDRAGKRRSVLWALAGSVVLTPLLLVPASFAAFLVPAAAVSMASALRQGPFAALLTEMAGDELRGSLVGWNSAASGVGLAAGTLLGGVLYASHQLAGAVGLAVITLAGSALVFLQWVPSQRALTATES